MFDRVVMTSQQLLGCSSLTFLKQTDLQLSVNLIVMHLQTCITFSDHLFWHRNHDSVTPVKEKATLSGKHVVVFFIDKIIEEKENDGVIMFFLVAINTIKVRLPYPVCVTQLQAHSVLILIPKNRSQINTFIIHFFLKLLGTLVFRHTVALGMAMLVSHCSRLKYLNYWTHCKYIYCSQRMNL